MLTAIRAERGYYMTTQKLLRRANVLINMLRISLRERAESNTLNLYDITYDCDRHTENINDLKTTLKTVHYQLGEYSEKTYLDCYASLNEYGNKITELKEKYIQQILKAQGNTVLPERQG